MIEAKCSCLVKIRHDATSLKKKVYQTDRLNGFAYTFAAVLQLLIKKGGGRWPGETLATMLLAAQVLHPFPLKAGEISQMPGYFVLTQNIAEHF